MIAYKYKEMADFLDLIIYEKNDEVGGTWLENRYPGVACDVPAHIYTFSWEPNPDWSKFYADGPEILEYIQRTAKKYDLYEKVKLRSKVLESLWDNTAGKWKIKVETDTGIIDDTADVLINGSGILKSVFISYYTFKY